MKETFVIDAITDINKGYKLFKNNKGKNICVFGSARTLDSAPLYLKATQLGVELANKGYTVVNGAGPGCMEAISKGAYYQHGEVIGCGIKLPFEQSLNKYLTKAKIFKNFYIRKRFLIMDAKAIVVFPGGYGTLDELFEVLCLIQTGKMEKIPVILVGRDFWYTLDHMIKHTLISENVISKGDEKLYTILDTVEDIMKRLK